MSGIIGGAGSKSGVIGQPEKKAVDAWVNFDGNGTINADYNISGVSGSISPYTISFDVNMNGTGKYAVSCSDGAASGAARNFSTGSSSLNASNFIWEKESSAGDAFAADTDGGSAIVIGE